jgi:hypothetical protein
MPRRKNLILRSGPEDRVSKDAPTDLQRLFGMCASPASGGRITGCLD